MKNFSKKFSVFIIMLSICAMGMAQKKVPVRVESSNKLFNPGLDMTNEYVKKHMENPDWNWVRQEFTRKYPEMNVDSLTHFTQAEYYLMTGDEKNRLKELAYLANTYGQTWKPEQLTHFAGIVIREDIGLEPDAVKWTKMALEKEPDTLMGKHLAVTYAYILAKKGNKKEALRLIGNALHIYPPDQPYLKIDRTMGYGLQKKRAMCNLFEVVANRAVWLNEKQKRNRYKGKVNFEKDKFYWNNVRDEYLVKEFAPKAADSVMLLGAMYYYESILNDTIGWVAPFVEYSEKYNNRTIIDENNNAWEVLTKSKKREELEKALKWSETTLHEKQYQKYTYHTYAGLLYKMGYNEKAITYQEKALVLVANNIKKTQEYQDMLDKMRKGKPID
ncbi:hypothetical protein [Sinomicrobium soli]|uniref:hypothetical protein n=1 Tax=Sinomicrobium sp. N-1-3-6 TaxID=2219864 RepID=UPI000DCE6062|nr:hypothetical protein [Sinomicrobium sp. N-1-3-6]RAV29467.1 hypothetical protein DN748_08165 [Sinomicrobium sp. N-1-3-6]